MTFVIGFMFVTVISVCRHLDGAVLETLSRPTLLITDSFSALSSPNRRKDRDHALTGKHKKERTRRQTDEQTDDRPTDKLTD